MKVVNQSIIRKNILSDAIMYERALKKGRIEDACFYLEELIYFLKKRHDVFKSELEDLEGWTAQELMDFSCDVQMEATSIYSEEL